MKIKLNLVLSLILEAVKAETHIKGQVDRAIDDKAAKMSYQEEAGDEEFHERKLMRGIYTSLDSLKSEISQYLASSVSTTGDNIVSTISTDTDSITLTLTVSDSFNTSLTDSLARLCSKYIEDATLTLWWGTFNVNQMQYYATLQATDLVAISKCFIKTAPKKPTTPYTTAITDVGDTVDVTVGVATDITYTIDDGAIDDIEFFSPHHILWERGDDSSFTITAEHSGIFNCKLYSLHDETVYKSLIVRATDE